MWLSTDPGCGCFRAAAQDVRAKPGGKGGRRSRHRRRAAQGLSLPERLGRIEPAVADLVKSNLRDPESFEHAETRITPVVKGKHTIIMQYRARNGFGGMNAETAMGTIDNATCSATLIGSL